MCGGGLLIFYVTNVLFVTNEKSPFKGDLEGLTFATFATFAT